MRGRGAAGAALLLLAAGARASAGPPAETVVTLEPRPGARLRLLLVAPPRPAGSVVLLAGGHGVLDTGPDGRLGWGAGNFLVRSRRLFAEAGLAAAVVDVAADLRDGRQARSGYRWSAEHAADVGAVVAHLRRQPGPVAVVGTSRGTISAANAAARLGAGGPDALVLSATTTRGATSVADLALERVRVAVLLVHHRDDPCPATPAADLAWLARRFPAAPRVDTVVVAGGGPERGPPCEAFSHHGFVGLEREVIGRIAEWMRGLP
jgi:hypothetical protein